MEKCKRVAECIGLWLAEGDTKTRREITFTNNCFELVEFFYENIKNLFSRGNYRLYVYLPSKKSNYEKVSNINERVYIDKRASKAYYIIRLASVDVVNKWKEIVELYKKNRNFYADILRGFFAGEGNLKVGSHKSRQIRISQKSRNKFIERILTFYKINARFSIRERAYVISGRTNWDKLAQIKISELHLSKKRLFWSIYSQFKEYHYSRNKIKDTIVDILDKPHTTNELAKRYDRSQSRIQRVLTKLKRERKVKCFRVRSNTFWLDYKQNVVLISNVKSKYLSLLKNKINTTNIIAKNLGVCPKSSYRRLKEMERLGIVKQDVNKRWDLINIDKEVIAL